MPALPRLTTGPMRALAERLRRYVPPEAARRQLIRAEALAEEVMRDLYAPAGTRTTDSAQAGAPDDRAYPFAWVQWRITGYREPDWPSTSLRADATAEPLSTELTTIDRDTDDGSDPEGVILAPALLTDLAALIEHLSVAAELTEPALPNDTGDATPTTRLRGRQPKPVSRRRALAADVAKTPAQETWLTIEDLCARWKVSRKTIERWRRQGLWCRRVRITPTKRTTATDLAATPPRRAGPPRRRESAPGRRGRESSATALSRSWFALSTVERFERLVRMRDLDGPDPASIRSPRSGKRLTPTVRRRIVRHAERYARLLHLPLMRICRRLAERYGTTPETIRRTLHSIEAEPRTRSAERSRTTSMRSDRAAIVRRLRAALPQGRIVGPTFTLPSAGEVLLAPKPVRTNLRAWRPASLVALTAEARTAAPADAETEFQRAVACCFLLWRAGLTIESSKALRAISADDLDRVVVDLLWAARLRTELVRSQIALVLRTIEATLDTPIDSLSAAETSHVWRLGLDAATAGTERFDPFKGGRLAAPVGLSVGRTLGEHRHALREAAPDPQTAPIKRTARRLSTSEHSDEARSAWRSAIDRVCAWRHAVEPTEALRTWAMRPDRADPDDEHARTFTRIRWGWSDSTTEQAEVCSRPLTLIEAAAQSHLSLAKARGLERRAMRLASTRPRGVQD